MKRNAQYMSLYLFYFRQTSDFICPSRFWVETPEEKDRLLTEYKVSAVRGISGLSAKLRGQYRQIKAFTANFLKIKT